MNKIPIKAENRVKLSEKGRSIYTKCKWDRKGYLASTDSHDGRVKVLWDGTKQPQVVWIEYIELTEPEEYIDWNPVKVNIKPIIDADTIQSLINYRNNLDKMMIEMNPLNEDRGRFMNESKQITRLIKQIIDTNFTILDL